MGKKIGCRRCWRLKPRHNYWQVDLRRSGPQPTPGLYRFQAQISKYLHCFDWQTSSLEPSSIPRKRESDPRDIYKDAETTQGDLCLACIV